MNLTPGSRQFHLLHTHPCYKEVIVDTIIAHVVSSCIKTESIFLLQMLTIVLRSKSKMFVVVKSTFAVGVVKSTFVVGVAKSTIPFWQTVGQCVH